MALCEQCYAEASRIKTRGWFHAWIADLALDGSQHSDGESQRPDSWQGRSHSWIASRARYESRWSLIGFIISSLTEQYRFHDVMLSTCLMCCKLWGENDFWLRDPGRPKQSLTSLCRRRWQLTCTTLGVPSARAVAKTRLSLTSHILKVSL